MLQNLLMAAVSMRSTAMFCPHNATQINQLNLKYVIWVDRGTILIDKQVIMEHWPRVKVVRPRGLVQFISS